MAWLAALGVFFLLHGAFTSNIRSAVVGLVLVAVGLWVGSAERQ